MKINYIHEDQLDQEHLFHLPYPRDQLNQVNQDNRLHQVHLLDPSHPERVEKLMNHDRLR